MSSVIFIWLLFGIDISSPWDLVGGENGCWHRKFKFNNSRVLIRELGLYQKAPFIYQKKLTEKKSIFCGRL